jgi:hypothetical protein
VSFHDNNLMGAATLADLDDDGELEIVAAEWDYPIGALHVVERNGVEWGGNWPVPLDSVAAATPGVADLDGDGRLEIVYQSYDSLYVLEPDGSAVAGWPKTLSNANFSYQSPAFEDLDGDGKLEIVVGAHGNKSGCYVFRLDGSTYPGWPQMVGTWTYCPPTVADLENDGNLEVLLGRAGVVGGASNAFWAWRTDGQVKPGFPYVAPGGGSESPLTVADLDDDGRREILAGSNIMASDGTGYLFGVDATGHDLPGFPLRPKGFTYLNGATIGDVDGDGDLELGAISYDGTTMDVNLYTLPGHYHPAQVEWATYMEKFERGGRRHGGDRLHTGGTFARGQNISFTLHDAPGDRAFLWVAAATAKIRHPAFGWFHLSFSPLLVALVRNATIPASGEVTLTVPIPNDPAFAGLPIYLEGLTGADLAGNLGAFTNVLGRVIQ